MTTETPVLHRVLAAVGASAMSLAIMLSYFAAPAVTYTSGIIA